MFTGTFQRLMMGFILLSVRCHTQSLAMGKEGEYLTGTWSSVNPLLIQSKISSFKQNKTPFLICANSFSAYLSPMVDPFILTQEEWEVGCDMLPVPWDVYHRQDNICNGAFFTFSFGKCVMLILCSSSALGLLEFIFMHFLSTFFFCNYAHYGAFIFLLCPKPAFTWAA